MELIARGVARRILLVVPPGLIDQWVEEMQQKFGLAFRAIEDSASLDQAQTALADGISPWTFYQRVITPTEYLKRPEVHSPALRSPWDVIVVDEAHYLAEYGSPASPYSTQRSRLRVALRRATRSLLLLTATPHNGYRHSFRSLLELIEPTDATREGDADTVRQRVRADNGAARQAADHAYGWRRHACPRFHRQRRARASKRRVPANTSSTYCDSSRSLSMVWQAAGRQLVGCW